MNIIDYIKWRGDLSFKLDPFNEVDALCYAQCSYTQIDEYFKNNDSLSIFEAGKLYFSNHSMKDIEESKSLVSKAPLVLSLMGNSKRFCDGKIHNFVSILSEENTEQFCAFEIDINDDVTIVAFRGTDDSAIGWKEDFEMFYKIVRAQKQAELYVNNNCKENRKYILLGHSKGGNLAAYASLHADKALRDKIIGIYSFDGPGLSKEYYDINIAYELDNRYVKYIPEFDFFGTLFEDNEKCIVVKSDAFAIMQHDAMSWQVERNNFVKADTTSPESDIIRNGVADFINNVSVEQRELLFKEIFSALDELKLNNISDITKAGFPALVRAIKKVGDMDESSKEAGNHLIDIIADVISYKVNDVANEATSAISSLVNEAGRAFTDSYKKIKKTINDRTEVDDK